MPDVRNKHVSAAITATAFNCPHCGALAKQTWHNVAADPYLRDYTPRIIHQEDVENADLAKVKEEKQGELLQRLERIAKGLPFIRNDHGSHSCTIENVWVARCFNCDEISIWVREKAIYPQIANAPIPNPDLSSDVLRDYREAGAILNESPRGAAALLRLAIQKICKELGGEGESINADIAHLVSTGLDKRVQQALDVVRVVGNNAVHPGLIDLRDNRAIAEKLFDLVNIIADIMISQPKHIQAMFDGLPAGSRRAIQKRDENP
jgi:hypothetical protein